MYIDEKKLEKYELSLWEFLYLWLSDFQITEDEMAAAERRRLERGWKNREILLNVTNGEIEESRIDSLSDRMIEIFPDGKSQGRYPYRGNKREIMRRLQKFFIIFGNEYTDEQILEATKRYVNSFNGNYKYMRVLKYFIWKDVVSGEEGERTIDRVSDLASWIENGGESEGTIEGDWTAELV